MRIEARSVRDVRRDTLRSVDLVVSFCKCIYLKNTRLQKVMCLGTRRPTCISRWSVAEYEKFHDSLLTVINAFKQGKVVLCICTDGKTLSYFMSRCAKHFVSFTTFSREDLEDYVLSLVAESKKEMIVGVEYDI